MDPTSSLGPVCSNNNIQCFGKHPAYCDCDPREEIGRNIYDTFLEKRTPSKVHRMDLGMVEMRSNDLSNDPRDVDAITKMTHGASFPSNGSILQNYAMPHNMNPSTSDVSYDNISNLIGYSTTVPSNRIRTSFTNHSTNSCYLLDFQHPVSANASISADGDSMHYAETILPSLPRSSKNCTDNGFPTVMPPDEYMTSDEPFNWIPSFATNTNQTIFGAALSEQCDIYSMSGSVDCSTVKSINPASSSGLTGNLNWHQLSTQSNLQIKPINTSSVSSEKDQFLLYGLQQQQMGLFSQQQHMLLGNRMSDLNQSQSILIGSYGVKDCVVQNQISNQSDQSYLQQNGQYFWQQHLSMGKGEPEWAQHQMVSEGHSRANSCFTQNQVTMQNMTEQFNPSIEGSKRKLNIASEGSAAAGSIGIPKGKIQYVKCHVFFCTYHHVLCCTVSDRKCEYPCCMEMKLLIHHVSHCSDGYSCKVKGCSYSKKMLTHYQKCQVSTCGICGPNKMSLGKSLRGTFGSNITEPVASFPTAISTLEQVQLPSKCIETVNSEETSRVSLPHKIPFQSPPGGAITFGHRGSHETFRYNITEPIASFPTSINTMEQEQPSSKRVKADDGILFHTIQSDTSKVSVSVKDSDHSLPEGTTLECQELSISVNSTLESTKQKNHAECCLVKIGGSLIDKPHVESSNTLELSYAQAENEGIQVPMEADKVRLKVNCLDTATLGVHLMETKLPKLKMGLSLIVSFSLEQIKEHMESLRQPVGQIGLKEKENQGSGHAMDMKNCSLCGMNNLHFDPPPQYCAACDIKIHPKKVCYSTRGIANESNLQIFFCCACINVPGETIKIHGTFILKANLEKRKNYAEAFDLSELWIQCHKCKAWQHQICALYNSIKNMTVKAYHTCPNCILKEIESGEHQPSLQRKIPGAKDLPTTILSNHLEKRIFRRLEKERHERANFLEKKLSEVPTAEGLVVRVVSSVVKKLEAKPVFRDIFREGTYPREFPYKSKAILLFQNIDGADVCLFAMYVQEYGCRCANPNRRRVCISYIDSVKYFRPEVKTVSGEALRTFVYHEILVGYFDYCKKRGFASLYMWACPPLKGGDDYILYCHPKIQKMPKDDKLREWYQKIIFKAKKEGIVAEHTNLYDHFFVKTSECKAKVTAARLPYFDGDYWPGIAELLLKSENSSQPQKKGTKALDRALRAFRRDDLIDNPKDILLMHQLGSNIFPVKENFIMVHLWHNCKHCCQPIFPGKKWVCEVCKNFQLCEKCFLIEQSLDVEDRHPVHTKQRHSFKVQVDDHLEDAIDDDDGDKTIQSQIFDTRLIFLGHCQNNYFQFDTLRRAKHSTMMILYNLHDPIPPPSPCDHDLVHRSAVTNHNSQQNNQITQVQSLEELSGAPLLHASTCDVTDCTYPCCRKLRGLFHHSLKCQIHVNGGCEYCRKIWCILRMHSQSCLESECHVPRCRDLKELLREKMSVADSQAPREDGHLQPSREDYRRRERGKEMMKERLWKRVKPGPLLPCS